MFYENNLFPKKKKNIIFLYLIMKTFETEHVNEDVVLKDTKNLENV